MTHKRRRQPKADKKDLIIRRLSVYLRTLDHLKGKGVEVVSSSDLEKIEGVTQSLVRRDLANFGTFGVRGSVILYLPSASRLRAFWDVIVSGMWS